MKINDELIKQVDTIYQLEREIEALRAKLKPLRDSVQEKLDYGTYTIGDHITIKTHMESTHIEAYDRKPYDILKIK